MNERIKEIRVKAVNYTNELKPLGLTMWELTCNQKFAELLLRDVMETQKMGEWDREHLCLYYGLEYTPVMMKHPEYGDLYQLDEWDEAVDAGYFNSDDGSGYWATKTEYAHISCWDEMPVWATHILWFNK